LAVEEELMKEKEADSTLQRQIDDEDYKKHCLEREIKRKAKIKQLERQTTDMSSRIKRISKQAMIQVKSSREGLIQKIQAMQRAAERHRRDAKRKVTVIRSSMAQSLLKENKIGNYTICFPNKTKHEREEYCKENFHVEDPEKERDCLLSNIDYCSVCCENEFGSNQDELRSRCYNMCDEEDEKPDEVCVKIPLENRIDGDPMKFSPGNMMSHDDGENQEDNEDEENGNFDEMRGKYDYHRHNQEDEKDYSEEDDLNDEARDNGENNEDDYNDNDNNGNYNENENVDEKYNDDDHNSKIHDHIREINKKFKNNNRYSSNKMYHSSNSKRNKLNPKGYPKRNSRILSLGDNKSNNNDNQLRKTIVDNILNEQNSPEPKNENLSGSRNQNSRILSLGDNKSNNNDNQLRKTIVDNILNGQNSPKQNEPKNENLSGSRNQNNMNKNPKSGIKNDLKNQKNLLIIKVKNNSGNPGIKMAVKGTATSNSQTVQKDYRSESERSLSFERQQILKNQAVAIKSNKQQ